MAKQAVYEILRDDDRMRRLETLRTLSEKNAAVTTTALLAALEETDSVLRSRAAWSLSLLPIKETPEVVKALAAHLQTDSDARIRLCCAIGIMGKDSPEVRNAYIHAVADSNDKVAQIACAELGFRGGTEATAVLFKTLANPSWRVRLEACKALITCKAADNRVVSALEAMAHEPEAHKYDAEIEEFDQMNRKFPLATPGEAKVETWGKLGIILKQAQDIAARKG